MKPVLVRVMWIVAASVLAGCAGSQPPEYFTLTSPLEKTGVAVVQQAGVLVQAGPVRLPDVLDNPEVQILSGSEQVVPQSRSLWRGDLADEVKTAVMTSILRDGRIAQVQSAADAPHAAIPLYGLRLGVDRMDLAPGQYARLETTWTIQPMSGTAHRAPVVCRGRWELPLSGAGLQPAIAAQQKMIQAWGRRVQRQLLGISGLLQEKPGACGE